MKRSHLILSSLVAVLAASSVAWAQEALVAANATGLQQVKSAVLLQKSASASFAQAAAAPAVHPAKKFELQHAWGRWTLWPNDNPSGLDINVNVGDHVVLTVSNVDTGRSGGISLVITGLNVREWIQPGASTVVKFDAKEPAVYRIEGVGLIVVRK
ncbi:MAG: hypothetical protein ACHQ49_13620 [Elusimicrobiota bacterium]